MQIVFRVDSVPVAQPRQRHRIIASQGRTFAQNYTPAKHPATQFKSDVKMAAAVAHPTSGPLSGALHVDVLFVMPRPKGMIWKKRLMPREAHTKKPDIDNLLKCVMDALKDLCWRDDSQVSAVTACKVIASGDETPHVVVRIKEESA